MTECPIVETPLGKVKGRCCAKAKKFEAKQVYRYAKIPFAEPPVGDLRFAPPQKSKPWNGVLDGTTRSLIPMQAIESSKDLKSYIIHPNEFDESLEDISEDCLYLDVYTSNPNLTAKMPVMVWIYGGAFQSGSSTTYDGSVLAGLHDVVVVIPNYRVSAYGFLSFDGKDSPCTGNMGLMDQTMALEWVRDNIKSFGGDSNNVTIFGESAGAISVSLHLKSPLSKPFFHKAISHSGVSAISMMVTDGNGAATTRLLKELKIEDEDQKTQLEKLRKVPSVELNNAIEKLVKEYVLFPAVKKDGKFLPETPETVMKTEKFAKVPYIIGINNTEGCGLLAPGRGAGFEEGFTKDQAKMFLDGMISFIAPPDKIEKVKAALIEEYKDEIGNENDKMYWSALLGLVSGEQTFLLSSIEAANEFSGKKVPTYFYYMSQQLRYNHDETYNPKGEAVMKSDFCQCDHSDDINFTFGTPLTNAKLVLDVKFSGEEVKLTEVWMKYLANFAYTGNPNKGPNKVITKWPKFDKKKTPYLHVCDLLKAKQNFKADRIKFWNKKIKSIIEK